MSNLPATANSAAAAAAATGRFADRSVDETYGNQTTKCVRDGAMKGDERSERETAGAKGLMPQR